MSFDTNYPDNPWDGMDTNQRKWYDPFLREFWVPKKVYSNFSMITVDTKGMPNSNSMEVTSVIYPRADITPLADRQIWMGAARFDSAGRTVSTERWGAKVAYHDADELITYWRDQGGNGNAVRKLVGSGLGRIMSEGHETKVRNAFLANSAYSTYGDGSGTDFGDVTAFQHRLSTSQIQEIQLGLQNRDVPFAAGEGPADLFCVTTPGVIFDLKREFTDSGNSNAYIDVLKYRDGNRIINGEIGKIHGVRFVASTRAYLFNCGEIVKQTTISAAANAGDGVNRAVLVDNVYMVGQQAGITNYIQVADVGVEGSEDAFKAGDILSIHKTRGSTHGVSNGAIYTEGTKFDVRVISVDYNNDRLVLEEPLPWDFATDLGGGTYGYVTKGRHIHSSVFVGGFNGVLQAVKHPPRLKAPPSVDDFEAVHRFSFDQRIGYHVWEPKVFEVHFGAGTYRYAGAAVR